ncbi:Stearoyl-CoA 9-desaturase [Rhodoplanes sp. Z2-YC6860]|nr:Stearoyl-CoA 9-desaturase [Rhodoplanes sp. Z2-YC6860]
MQANVNIQPVGAGDTAHAPAPASGYSRRIKWRYAVPIAAAHLVALLAFIPWFFSWTGVVLMGLGLYVFGTLGINLGYHRLLTHRSFSSPRWLERTLAVLGACCAEESPTVWVAWHRRHHHVADEELDPHTPLRSFVWGHIGWLVIKSDNTEAGPLIGRYAADLMSDPFYARLETSDNWLKLALSTWVLYFAAGFGVAMAQGASTMESIQFGSSLLVWGAAVRTVLVWHASWSINSATHVWGYRSFDTPDNSRNNLLVALLTNGEGWHNNHHADPRSARHGRDWREPDVAWLTIRGLAALGLARNVALPSRRIEATVESG